MNKGTLRIKKNPSWVIKYGFPQKYFAKKYFFERELKGKNMPLLYIFILINSQEAQEWISWWIQPYTMSSSDKST